MNSFIYLRKRFIAKNELLINDFLFGIKY